MDFKEYYYKRFREQFTEFIKKSKAHEHPNEGIYISVQDLNKENLSHIPSKDYMLFYCALACTVLVDQVMYTHFKNDYPKFQQMTQYPKIEYGITNINVNPWDIARRGSGLTTFEKFASFFIRDLEEFFSKHKFSLANWKSVKIAMLSDPDVSRGSYGEIFVKFLKSKT